MFLCQLSLTLKQETAQVTRLKSEVDESARVMSGKITKAADRNEVKGTLGHAWPVFEKKYGIDESVSLGKLKGLAIEYVNEMNGAVQRATSTRQIEETLRAYRFDDLLEKIMGQWRSEGVAPPGQGIVDLNLKNEFLMEPVNKAGRRERDKALRIADQVYRKVS